MSSIIDDMTANDRDYVLGTHDEEIERLGLQHNVWRPRAMAAWQRGGFTVGQTLIDVGCGPGYATLDLAELVGAHGRIVAVDRSRRFLDTLDALETTFKQNMLLKSHEPAKDTFENLAEYDKALMSTQPRTSAWIRRGPDEMVAHSDIIGSDGKPAVIEVVYRRVK